MKQRARLLLLPFLATDLGARKVRVTWVRLPGPPQNAPTPPDVAFVQSTSGSCPAPRRRREDLVATIETRFTVPAKVGAGGDGRVLGIEAVKVAFRLTTSRRT